MFSVPGTHAKLLNTWYITYFDLFRGRFVGRFLLDNPRLVFLCFSGGDFVQCTRYVCQTPGITYFDLFSEGRFFLLK